MYPRTSPAALALVQKVPEDAATQPRRPALPEPLGQTTRTAADEPAPLKPCQSVLTPRDAGRGVPQRNDLRDGLVPVQHQDRPAAPDVIEVAGQAVLELGDPGLLHMAMLATSGVPSQRRLATQRTASRRGPSRSG